MESMVFELKIKKDTWYLIFTYKKSKTSNKLFINKLNVAYDLIRERKLFYQEI